VDSNQGKGRQTTWENRRLFHEFRSIVAEERLSIRNPEPEELPIEEVDYLFGTATPALAQMLPESESRRLTQRKNLTAAGYQSRAAWQNLSALRFIMAFSALILLGLLLIMAPPEAEPIIVGALVIVPLLMWALPPLVVASRASERVRDIEMGLPDVLDMLNMCVSQGLTVVQSLRRISREVNDVHPSLGVELGIVTRQAEVSDLSHALKAFAARIESPEVTSFTSLLVQSDVTGTALSRALTEYSDSIRATLKERADTRANSASFQLLFPVSLLLMPAVFLFLLGPAIVQISEFYGSQSNPVDQSRQQSLQSLNRQSPNSGNAAANQ